MAEAPVLTPRAQDFPRWYQDLIGKAELADNGPVRGTMVIRPYGYGLWERMQAETDARIKRTGAENAYFPLLIPQSYLTREADHVECFAPELAVVTHGGGKELEEPAVVRPTSETIVNEYFSRWVQSYRDLPLLINQWANVVRWELRPRLFLRTSESSGRRATPRTPPTRRPATSRGSTTRMIGALVMTHGDDDGLRVPPRLAQIQVVVLAVADDEAVLAKVRELGGRLAAAGLRVRVDDRTDVPLGRRAVDWELKGVPVRVEIGPRDLADGTAMLVRRIPGGKEAVAVDALAGLLPVVLEEDQALLPRQSRERRESRTADVSTVGEAVEAVGADGWARVPLAALDEEGEAGPAEQSLTVRCLVAEDGAVPDDGDAPGNVAVVARAC
ncbi:prolyl-tRNA synthetase [Streptomyces achromogenes]|uniref:Prolyl-tRNA synthetase n=1 Tax=Streptomyces achromogenes TaxID=67255 RepID=A0ABU0Q777_STRAH|nr:prolyl-tRNA synthetase [Streptomyces achromogenes]